MRVIFLDIDGVLNSEKTFLSKNKQNPDILPLEKEKIELLKYLIDATGAKVVISSSWRIGGIKNPVFAKLLSKLKEHEIPVLGATPVLGTTRGKEIQEWLKSTSEKVSSFVILDDDNDMEDLSKNLVQTNWSGEEQGLTFEKTLEAINLLVKDRIKR